MLKIIKTKVVILRNFLLLGLHSASNYLSIMAFFVSAFQSSVQRLKSVKNKQTVFKKQFQFNG